MNFREQRENFRNKKISAKEAVQEALGKVENDKLNIFISGKKLNAENLKVKSFCQEYKKTTGGKKKIDKTCTYKNQNSCVVY